MLCWMECIQPKLILHTQPARAAKLINGLQGRNPNYPFICLHVSNSWIQPYQ